MEFTSCSTVKNRVAMEKRILKSAVEELINHGFTITIRHEGEPTGINASTDVSAIIEEAHGVDECQIDVKSPTANGAVFFVYGNDGYDIICDYTMNLEPYLVKTFALADKLELESN